MHGIKAIADALDLSASTVSRALNGVYGVNPQTRKLVEEMAQKMGYIPHLGAKQLVSNHSNLIGVFLPEFEPMVYAGYLDMFSPVQRELHKLNKDTLFFSIPFLNYPAQRLVECISSRRLEGCLLFSGFSSRHPIVQEAIRLKIPTVNFENVVDEHCSSVVSNDWEGGRLVAQLLLRNGHRKMGYIGGPPNVRCSVERYSGFVAALAEYGIVHEQRQIATGYFTGEGGADGAMELLHRNPDMTAIFCANDLMAIGAIAALSSCGVRVPDQMSIVGYDDDIYAAHTSPPLTTVHHQLEETSVMSAQLLQELLEGNYGRGVFIPPQLVERRSVRNLIDDDGRSSENDSHHR
ncbi:MAG: LacI family DNA-binding transcriptional regulator [Candidatus Cohnella colombiensis]|uniref:LacI family DNA-binding transcriptional regulator n=1 Tax=Candidatus Cohnella colombiensis TaxID=3121368 RepID=A0AA95F2E4_9BACL|nr:MAG: LacI family DNA-binding transcriptional regulator [Cohnella sp.]